MTFGPVQTEVVGDEYLSDFLFLVFLSQLAMSSLMAPPSTYLTRGDNFLGSVDRQGLSVNFIVIADGSVNIPAHLVVAGSVVSIVEHYLAC